MKNLKSIMVAGLFALPMMSFNLQAQIGVTWNPGATSPAYWQTPGNWGGTVPGPGYKAFFNVTNVAPCIVNDTEGGCQISIGDGGPSNGVPATVIVTNGGNLTCGDTSLTNLDLYGWTDIGRDFAGTMIIYPGASVTFNYHVWVGQVAGGTGTLIMYGGTATMGNGNGAFGIGPSGGTGVVHLYGGILNLNNNIQIPNPGPQFDIAGGTLIVNGDATGTINTLTNAGKMVAYGGTGTVVYDYNISNAGKTTVTGSPGVAVPQPTITHIAVDSSHNVTIVYSSQNSAQYHIQSTASLSAPSWSTVPGSSTTATGTSTQFNYTDSSGSKTLFYRVVVGP